MTGNVSEQGCFGPADARSPAPRIRDAVATTQARLDQRFRQGEPVAALVEARARFVDDVLTHAWRRFGLDDHAHRALVAVGGYGRGELHPGSDIDLLILTRRAMRGDAGEKVRDFLAFLWDVGLAVGNSVRTVRECVAESRRDVTVATNLMDGRLICGSADLVTTSSTTPARTWSRTSRTAPAGCATSRRSPGSQGAISGRRRSASWRTTES